MEGYSLYSQSDMDAHRPPLECLVMVGTRGECVDYLRQNDPNLRNLYMKSGIELPEVMPETHRYFYPEAV